jgi:hypothetical protein
MRLRQWLVEWEQLLKVMVLFGSLVEGQLLPSIDCRAKESLPNPIASQYPSDVTGTVNGTIAVIPIPYSLARSIVPSQYGILSKAYAELMPQLPKGMYPVRRPFKADKNLHW